MAMQLLLHLGTRYLAELIPHPSIECLVLDVLYLADYLQVKGVASHQRLLKKPRTRGLFSFLRP